MNIMDSALQRARFCPTLKIGDQPITVTKAERLDPNRTLYRVRIEPFDDLPRTIIVKQQKDGWCKEFQQETEAYAKMKNLQGDLIPQLFGQCDFDGVPALILSEIVGVTLHDLARSKKSINEKIMESQLEAAFSSLSTCGAIYWDQKLDNFLLCENGDCNNGKVMVVDLEQVQFPTTFRSWQLNVNQEGARSLMRDFRDIRHQDRERSPIRFWRSDAGSRDEASEKSAPSATNPIGSTQSMNPGNIESPFYIVA